ncbi:MAG: OsmC family protein [Hyphomicrobiales bacterium]|jgi:uncharacterized OsmC-like protein|nr:OsmC family protein [Xanthobacteraceae bacterium]
MAEEDVVTLSPIASAWNSLSEALRAHPDKARAKYAPATATLESGLKCRVTGPSGEQIETDMPPALGGAGSGPNPGWFFRASVAACCSTVIAAQAARLGINLTKLEVTVEGEGDHRGMLGVEDAISAGHSAIRTDVRISAQDATSEQLEELVQWAAAHSPVGCTVRDAPSNSLSVVVV